MITWDYILTGFFVLVAIMVIANAIDACHDPVYSARRTGNESQDKQGREEYDIRIEAYIQKPTSRPGGNGNKRLCKVFLTIRQCLPPEEIG